MQHWVRLCALVLLGALLPGCATALSQERRDYILAHPHGWVELSVKDEKIPDVPVEEDGKEVLEKPSSCRVRIEIDEEPYFGDYVYPHGEEQPYVVDSGFRFPVPVGEVELAVSYSGCDIEEGERATRETGIVVNIEEGTALDVAFDGQSLVAGVASPDTKVTLEDIYEAVTGSRSVE
jgi:hypothetical protein